MNIRGGVEESEGTANKGGNRLGASQPRGTNAAEEEEEAVSDVILNEDDFDPKNNLGLARFAAFRICKTDAITT